MVNLTCGLDYASLYMNVGTFESLLQTPSNVPSGMVLFYCTAIAMKRQDHTPIAEGLEDVFLPGERIMFAG